MPEKCPRCGNSSIDYCSHYGQKACHVTGCTTLVNGDNSYSYIRHSKNNQGKLIAERVKVVKTPKGSIEESVMYNYNLD